jgi:L-asparaginase
MLKPGRCLLDADIESLMMIDSLQMTDVDRALIRDGCATCPERRIVITYGTDTI